MKRKYPIKNMDDLEKEMLRLKMRNKQIERELDNNLDFLKDNYRSMALNSILGRKSANGTNHFWAGITTRVMDNEKLQSSVGTLVENLINRLSEGLEKAYNRIFRK